MEKLVWEYIKEQKLVQEGQNVGAAVSGGPDSMALLVCLCSLAKAYQFNVFCVHFEHGIRGEESLADAEFVSQYCNDHGIPLYTGAADVPLLSRDWCMSEETAAKRAREEYFNALVERSELDVIATGHHKDDNAESILMHILRGSGLNGLAGIHSRCGNIIRPFLCVDREEILRYTEKQGLAYVMDASNCDNRHRRNYIRNVLLPQIQENLNADVTGALNRLSAIVRDDADFIAQEARSAYARCAVRNGDKIDIDVAQLNSLHAAIAVRVIRFACGALHIIQDIENQHVRSVLRLVANNHTGTRVNLSHNLCAQVEYGVLSIGFTGREADHSFEMRFDLEAINVLPNGDRIEGLYVDACDTENTDGYSECFDADKLPKNMVVRTRYAGDTIHPLNCAGSKKLKDYFIDKKLPREARAKAPLLADGGKVIWAIGHVISNDYRVDENTTRIINLIYTKVREDMKQ